MLRAKDLAASISSCRWTETGSDDLSRSDDLLDSPSRVNWHVPLTPIGLECAHAGSNRRREDIHVRLSLPMRLQLCMPLGRSGAPDLRMQLFEMQLGARERNEEPMQCTAQAIGRCNGTSNCRPSCNDQLSPGGADGDQQTARRRAGFQPETAPEADSVSNQCGWWPQYGAADVAHAAGALLLATVMLPDLAGPGTRALARHGVKAHAAAALWNWAGLLLRKRRRRAGGRGLGREGGAGAAHAGGGGGLSNTGAGKRPATDSRRRSGAADELSQQCLSLSGSAARLALRLCAASMLLSAGGAAWSVAHSSSCHMATAVAALAAVLMDSKQLRRQAALGRIKHGPDLEQAWRAHHRRSGLRVAHLLTDLPASPPLAPALDFAERVSIRIGAPCCSGPTWTRMGGTSALSASFSFQLAQASPMGRPTSSSQLVSSAPSQQPEAPRSTPPPQQPEAPRSTPPPPAAPTGTPQGQLCSADLEARGTSVAELRDTEPLATSETAAALAREGAEAPLPGPASSVAELRDAAPLTASAEEVPAPVPDPALSDRPLQGAEALPLSCSAGSSLASPTSHLVDNISECDVDVSPMDDADGALATSGEDSPSCKSSLMTAGELEQQSMTAGELEQQSIDDDTSACREQPVLEITNADDEAGQGALGGASLPGGPSTTTQAAAGTSLPKWPAPGSFRAAADAAGLSLYGRGDHDSDALVSTGTGFSVDRLFGLSRRAAFLLMAFLPFLALGIPLLLLSTWAPAGGGSGGHEVADVAPSKKGRQEETTAVALRRAAWWTLLLGCRMAGAATIKWGQWASTREDLFPQDFCEVISTLHDRAPAHSFRHTRETVEAAMGMPLERAFVSFEPQPLASASVAQVHRASMLLDGQALPVMVAVKVAHPHCAHRISLDFALLRALAGLTSGWRPLRGLGLQQTLSQFSHTMTAQCDLRVEAVHLERFYQNFATVASQVTTPRPLWASRDVLVESFEPGASVTHFIRRHTPFNAGIVALGVDTYLSMLLKHNFVHTDLHPGNILVRVVDDGDRVVSVNLLPEASAVNGSESPGSGAAPSHLPVDSLTAARPPPPSACSESRGTVGSGGSGGGGVRGGGIDNGRLRTQLVLLDFGLAEELTPEVRHHFVSFLNAICSGNGQSASRHLLHWGAKQRCSDRSAFSRDIVKLFERECDIRRPCGIDLDKVMKEVLRISRLHEVTVDSCYAALVIGVCVIVGFATSLDPGVNIMDAAAPCLLFHSLTGRVVGRLYG